MATFNDTTFMELTQPKLRPKHLPFQFHNIFQINLFCRKTNSKRFSNHENLFFATEFISNSSSFLIQFTIYSVKRLYKSH